MPSSRHYSLSTLPHLPSITNPQTHLLSSLTYILKKYPPTLSPAEYSFSGLYYGPTSIAFLFLRLEQAYPGLVVCKKECRSWAAEYLLLSIVGEGGDDVGGDDGAGHVDLPRSLSLKWLLKKKKISQKKCGVGCESLARVVVYAVLNMDEELAREVCVRVGEAVNIPPLESEQEDESSDEWLYGRSGFLYFLRFLKYSFPASQLSSSSSRTRPHSVIDTTIQQTITRIIQTYRYYRDATNTNIHRTSTSTEMVREGNKGRWRWHGKEYFGAVHGLAGIIAQVVLSCNVLSSSSSKAFTNNDHSGDIAAVPLEIKEAIEELLNLQIGSGNSSSSGLRGSDGSGGKATGGEGNWPSSRESMHKNDRLVQLCHGAPGVVISLMAIAGVINKQHQAEPGAQKAEERPQEKENPTEKAGVKDTEGKVEKRRKLSTSTIITTTSFTTLSNLFLTRILLACELARKEVIPSRGLLTKQPSLCHGITGNALAFLPSPPPLSNPSSPSPLTENHNYNFQTMKTFLAYTTREFLNQQGRKWFFRSDGEDVENEDVIDEEMGLWTGEAGRAWGFVILDKIEKEIEMGRGELGKGWQSEWGGKVVGFNDV